MFQPKICFILWLHGTYYKRVNDVAPFPVAQGISWNNIKCISFSGISRYIQHFKHEDVVIINKTRLCVSHIRVKRRLPVFYDESSFSRFDAFNRDNVGISCRRKWWLWDLYKKNPESVCRLFFFSMFAYIFFCFLWWFFTFNSTMFRRVTMKSPIVKALLLSYSMMCRKWLLTLF